jgi:hypothetical protein
MRKSGFPSSSQFLKSEDWGRNHMTQGIKEQIGALAAIESELHLREIRGQMLRADLVPTSNDAALQKRKRGFHGVRMNVCPDPHVFFMGVIHRLVLVPADGRLIAGQFVGNDYIHICANIFLDVLRQRSLAGILSMEEPDISATLTDSNNNLFRMTFAAPSLSVATRFAANIGFVHLNSAVKHRAIYFFHGSTDAMAEVPRGLIADSQSALDLIRAHSLPRFTEKQGCEEPLLQWEMGVIEDRSGGHSELVVSLFAVEELLRGRQFHGGHLTAQALDACGPAEPDKNLTAFFVSVKQIDYVN